MIREIDKYHHLLKSFQSLEDAAENLKEGQTGIIHYVFRDEEAPFFLFLKGCTTGKTVWVQGGLHGDEYEGIYACLQLAEHLNLNYLRGNIILCPSVNTSAFEHGQNQTHADGININRVFGKKYKNTLSWEYGHWLEKQILNQADFFVDLHGGGKYLDVVPFANMPGFSRETAGSMLERLDIHYIYIPPRDSPMLVASLARKGIPGVLLESGGGISINEIDVVRHEKNVIRLLGMLGLLPEEEIPPLGEDHRKTVYVHEAEDVYFEHDGLLMNYCQAGSLVQAGNPLFEVADMKHPGRSYICCADSDRVVLSIHTASLVKRGDYAVMLGKRMDDAEEGRERIL